MDFGLTLPNRGVLFGATTTDEMLDLAGKADASGMFRSIWVGDSLLGKPRPESITLLAAIAARTRNVRFGPACMASFPLRDPILLAQQWATLDLISGGRSVLVTCTGIIPLIGGKIEAELYGVSNRDRVERLIEGMEILKLLWTEDDVTYEGKHYRFSNITMEPKPAAKPRPPIWLANNAMGERAAIERTHQRVIDYADGWQTSLADHDDVRWRIEDIRAKAEASGVDPDGLAYHAYHNCHVSESRETSREEAKRFLDAYYTGDFPAKRVNEWVAAGTPGQCVEHLHALEELGFTEVTMRMPSWDQQGQYERLAGEVLPLYRERYG
jgi:alkanesulfonate monooxygenase SsuD/methylene tetrahydromethanopterin reductase-like flavin-dependent oxidoreductase (luciferase family)